MSGYTFANWRIALLAMTSVVLSIASGWTTWDGMSNFTSAPALSFLITFGIQATNNVINRQSHTRATAENNAAAAGAVRRIFDALHRKNPRSQAQPSTRRRDMVAYVLLQLWE